MPSVYVAAKFEDKALVKTMMTDLQTAGYTISHDWTDDDDTGLTGQAKIDYWAARAKLDLQGVQNADYLILVPHNYGKGSYTELGIALGAGKTVFVWRKHLVENENIFVYTEDSDIHQIAGSKDWLWEFEKQVAPKFDIQGAIGSLLAGTHVRRLAWPDSRGHAEPGATEYTSTPDDLLGTDWFAVPAWRIP